MAKKMKSLENLEKLRETLQTQIESLKNQLAGVEMAIRTVTEGEVTDGILGPRKRTRNVKDHVLRLVQAAGPKGLSANDVVAKAAVEGITLDRGSVSSLLSRLKREGTLSYNGSEYILVPTKEPKISVVSSN
jgi:hypothetical protein